MPEGTHLAQPEKDGPVFLRRGDLDLTAIPELGGPLFSGPDGQDVAAIVPPQAVDAQGALVEARMQLRGDDVIELSVPHRAKDLAYPILVDPPVGDSWYFGTGHRPFTDYWKASQTDGTYKLETSDFLGQGLYVRVLPGSYGAGTYGRWEWRDPFYNTRTNYIDHVDFYNQHTNLLPQFQLANHIYSNDENRPAASRFTSQAMSGATVSLRWPNGITPPPNGPEKGDGVRFEAQAKQAYTVTQRRDAYVANVVTFLTDPEAPVLRPVEHVSKPAGWIRGGTYSAKVRATDPGLGIDYLAVEAPNAPRAEADTDCSGSPNYSPCPTDATRQVDYNTDSWPEGVNPAQGLTADMVGRQARSSETWEVKVDRTAPSLNGEPTGSLYENRNRADDHRREGLYDAQASIRVEAEDDPAAADNATTRSGTKSLELWLDKNRDGGYSSDEKVTDQPTSGCTADQCPNRGTQLAYTLDTDSLLDGDYRVKLVGKDLAGNAADLKEWTVTVDRVGNVARAEAVSGTPTSRGVRENKQWAQLGTLLGRIEVEDVVNTRDRVPCDHDQNDQCDEFRSLVTDADDPDFQMARRQKGTSITDPMVSTAPDILLIGKDQGAPVQSGPLLDALAPWQRPPSAHGSLYQRFDIESAGSDGTEDQSEPDAGSTRPTVARLWIDAATKQPLRLTEVVNGEEDSDDSVYWTYDTRVERESLPNDFFSVDQPQDPATQSTMTSSGGRSVGPQSDVETGRSFSAYGLGLTPELPDGIAGCLSGVVRLARSS